MRAFKRPIALAGALLLAGALAAPATAREAAPSRAAEPAPATYAAEAQADALLLTLFGQQLTVGAAESSVTSPDSAAATGSGALLVSQGFGSSSATAEGAGASDGSTTPSCSPLTLPASVPILDLSVACSSAVAEVPPAGPTANATGQALEIGVGGDPLVQPVLDALPITTITDTLISGLGGLLDTVLPLPTDVVVGQVNQLLTDALTGDGVTLLKIEAGGSDAHTEATADTVTATSLAKGAVVKLLDRGGTTFGTQPVLQIEVGDSTSSVTRDVASGETTAEVGALVVTITVADDVALLLGLPESSITVPLGQAIDLPLPAPLNSTIVLTEGSTEEVEGGVLARSAVLDVQLLKGLNGGVRLAVGSGSTSVVGTIAEPTAPEPTDPAPTPTTATAGSPRPVGNAPAPRTSLPRTGIEDDQRQHLTLVLALAGLALGSAVIWAGRRSRRGA